MINPASEGLSSVQGSSADTAGIQEVEDRLSQPPAAGKLWPEGVLTYAVYLYEGSEDPNHHPPALTLLPPPSPPSSPHPTPALTPTCSGSTVTMD